MSLDPHSFDALTVDCYGTLIDWDGGIRTAFARAPSLAGLDLARLVGEREEAERAFLQAPFRPYGSVLADSLVDAARRQGHRLAIPDAQDLAATMGSWPPFADSARALVRLAERYRIMILSNVETRVLEESLRLLGSPPVELVTAEHVHSYKPAPAHWHTALARLALSRERVVHVGGSLYHDIGPACALGFRSVWIDRRGARDSGGTHPAAIFPDLAGLAGALGI